MSSSSSSPSFATPEPDRKKSHLDRFLHRSHSGTPPATPGSAALLKIPASPCLEKLGYGTGVNVYLYHRSPQSCGKPRSPWAVKRLNPKKAEDGGRGFIAKRLEEEAKILRKLKHPNIIGYRGFKRTSDGCRILAVENGEKALLDMIEEMREDGGIKMDADKILFVVEAIALALDYLHMEHRLLHGDIKSGNILVMGDFEAVKLCDFGVTLTLDSNLKVSDKSQSYVGTGPWTAKEALDDEDEENEDSNTAATVSNKTDVFALGCVIYEMLALEAPHVSLLPTEDDDDDDESSFDESEYYDALGTRPMLPEDLDLSGKEYQKVVSIFYACTEEDPEKRPSAKMILESLKEL